MEEIKVSVIVAIYNGEKFIDKCFNSLINQTHKNIEIIAINDGSKDNTLEILKEYSEKYPFIKSYSYKNVGQSIARNYAIQKATGEFITVLDVDDWLDEDFIEKMLKGNTQYDIVIGGYRRVYSNGTLDFSYILEESEWNKYRRGTVWAKMYKSSFLKKNKIVYPNDRVYGEDVVYTLRCMSKNPKVTFADYIGYNNLINEKSLTHTTLEKIKTNVPKIIKHCDEYISKNKSFIRNSKKYIKYYYLKIIASYLIEQASIIEYKSLKEYYFDSTKQVKEIFKNYNYKYSFAYQKSEPFKVNFVINAMVLFDKLHCSNILLKLLNGVYYHEKK